MINDKLKELRERNNLKQKEIADKLYITKTCYSNYEQGTRKPSIEMLKKISQFYNISMDELMEQPNTNNNDGITYPQRYIEATEEEKQILFDYRNLSDEYKHNFKCALDILKKADK